VTIAPVGVISRKAFVVQKRYFRLALLLLLSALALGVHLWAATRYRAAREALARGDYSQAQQHLARCARVWLWGAETRLLQARAARLAGEYDRAESYLRSCEELGGPPDRVAVERALRRVQQGDLASGEKPLVSRVLRGDPDTVLILETLTPAFLSRYRLLDAAECVKRWLEREPDRLQAWSYQAKVFDLLKDQDQALASYRRIVQLDPDNLQARLTLAGLVAELDPQEAVGCFGYVRDRQGDSPALLAGLARCRLKLGQPDEARQLLDAALAVQPDSWAALSERARLALQTESAEEAEKWFRRALALKPYEPDVLHGFHSCLVQAGKKKEAEEVWARVARVKADMDQVSALTRQVAAQPHDPALRCEVGTILMRNGLEKEGLGWLATALQEDPSHPATHRILAEYYERTGDAQRAAEHRAVVSTGTGTAPLPRPEGAH
jgi:tetratricopeptide (TPR) repeat protein